MEMKTLKTNPFFLLPVWKQQTMNFFKSIVEHAILKRFWLNNKEKQIEICCSI
jgi:hypothetical protein